MNAVIALTALALVPAHVARAEPTQAQGANMTDRENLATEGAKDRLKGAAKQAEGRIRSTVGGATGDTTEQLKGKGQEIKGKLQHDFGKAEQDVDEENRKDRA